MTTRLALCLLVALCLLGAAVLTPASASAGSVPQWAPPHVASGSPVVVPSYSAARSKAPGLSGAAPDTVIRPVPMILPTLPPPTVAEARAIIAAELGPREWSCLDAAIERESHWNPLAVNKRSGAAGLLQALPPEKQARFGPDWRTSPLTQVRWAAWYVAARYGDACRARAFQLREGWL
jgi:hypothetical protein